VYADVKLVCTVLVEQLSLGLQLGLHEEMEALVGFYHSKKS